MDVRVTRQRLPSLTSVAGFLEAVDDLPPASTGALVFGPATKPEGAVLVEDGRVCWAVASGLPRRLPDLLRSRVQLEPVRLNRLVRKCLEAGTPLGEAVVAEGLASNEEVRAILQQHTAEGLLHLSTRPRGRPVFQPHRRPRYDARFTYTPVELFVSCGSLVTQSDDALALQLERDTQAASGAVAFRRAEGHAQPVAVAARGQIDCVRSIDIVGRWAVSTLDLTRAFDPETKVVTASRPDGGSCLAWSEGQTVFVALAHDRSSTARLIGDRWRALLSTRG